MKTRKSVGPADNLDWICARFMKHLRSKYRGHKAEISARALVKVIALFANTYGLKENILLDALLRRNWLEPIGSDHYAIRYELIRK